MIVFSSSSDVSLFEVFDYGSPSRLSLFEFLSILSLR